MKYARNMLKYAVNMQLYASKMQVYANNMQEICKKYAIILTVIVEYAKKICRKICRNMQVYMQNMHNSISCIYCIYIMMHSRVTGTGTPGR